MPSTFCLRQGPPPSLELAEQVRLDVWGVSGIYLPLSPWSLYAKCDSLLGLFVWLFGFAVLNRALGIELRSLHLDDKHFLY